MVSSNAVISMVIAVIMISIFLPIGLESLYDMDVGNFSFPGEEDDEQAKTLVMLIPLFLIIAIVVGVVSWAKSR